MLLSHVHMGSVFSLDLILFLTLVFYLNPQMPPRRDPEFVFPPEITQLIQQQNTLIQTLVQNQGNNNNNNPPPPPPVDHLTRFLRLNPPVYSRSTEPIVADDWLR